MRGFTRRTARLTMRGASRTTTIIAVTTLAVSTKRFCVLLWAGNVGILQSLRVKLVRSAVVGTAFYSRYWDSRIG
jgi:hypothetical protein